jgi:hypothetical protein
MNNQKKQEKEDSVPNNCIEDDLFDKRYEEADKLVYLLMDFPGSTLEELRQLFPCRKHCFNRYMSWLKLQGIIYQEGDYYYFADKD